MSSIANWSYTYKATVTPFLGEDGVSGVIEYGTPYEIMCNVAAIEKQVLSVGGQGGANGLETVGTHTIYTEDARPQKGDMIEFEGSNGKQEILDRTFWEMTAFGDTPDYKLVT